MGHLDASSPESALDLENRSQILASAGGVIGEATEAFRHRQLMMTVPAM